MQHSNLTEHIEVNYQAVLSHHFDPVKTDPDLTFEKKIERNNLWDENYTRRVILEYKRFIYLAAKYGGVAPSDAVDQVWHQHILYTRDYRNFCMAYFGKFIQHNPDRTKGQSNDSASHTKELYHMEFGLMPADIWETSGEYARVNLDENYVVPFSVRTILKVLYTEVKFKLFKK